jgi:hypothetical protein
MTSGRALTLRPMQRLRNLSEAECYARCYGWRMDDVVTVTKIEPRRPRYELSVSGELLRTSFESKLDAREPEAA